jgi:hypothetical protein
MEWGLEEHCRHFYWWFCGWILWEKVDPMQQLIQAPSMKQMKEQVRSLFFHHCVTRYKQQQGMWPVIVLHFLLLLLVIISFCWLTFCFL